MWIFQPRCPLVAVPFQRDTFPHNFKHTLSAKWKHITFPAELRNRGLFPRVQTYGSLKFCKSEVYLLIHCQVPGDYVAGRERCRRDKAQFCLQGNFLLICLKVERR